MKRFVVATALICAGSLAHADGLIDKMTTWRWPAELRPGGSQLVRGIPSPAERAYGAKLGADAPVARIGHFFHTPQDPTHTLAARGVRVRQADGTVIDRYFLDTPEDAVRYALYGAELGKEDSLAEVRGKQVVVVRGAGLSDPARARQLMSAAWNDALPVPDAAAALSATRLTKGGSMLVWRGSDPILDAELQETLDGARSRAEGGKPGFTRRGPSDVAFETSRLNGFIKRADGLLTMVFALSAKERRELDQQLARALGPSKPAPQPPLAPAANGGAASTLSSLFD